MDDPHQDQGRTTATGTNQGGWFDVLDRQVGHLGHLGSRSNLGQEVAGFGQPSGTAPVGVQTIVTNFHEPWRQDVEAETTQELV